MGPHHGPRHHEVVTVRTLGRLRGMRVILTEHGPLGSFVEFLLVPRRAALSPSWQSKAAHAVGLLYDYTVACPPAGECVAAGEYLSEFVRYLRDGTVCADGTDSTGLRWPAATRGAVLEVLRFATAFTDWCAKTFGGVPANPLEAGTYGERVAALYRLEGRNAHSLFAHLGNARALLDGDVDADEEERGGVPRRARGVVAERDHHVVRGWPPCFPRQFDHALLADGFRRRRVPRGEFWEQHNVRDMMLAVLWRYGGLRRGEPLHLYVGDVLPNAETGGCRVLLFHPEDGLSPAYRHPSTGAAVETTRAEYLKRVWGMAPRSREVGARRAGWKGLMLERPRPHLYAMVHWRDDDASRLFRALHTMYLRFVRPRACDHPFLFAGSAGRPLSLERAGDLFAAATRRIGLLPTKEAGTTPHGLRHAYARDLKDAGMRDEHIQICMHHNLITSQQVYTAPQLAAVDAGLSQARRAMQATGAGSPPPALVAAAVRSLPA